MKPRERCEIALNHEEPDRPPFQATFTPEFADRLRKELRLSNSTPHDPHSGRWNTYDLEIATHQDALQCSIGWVTNYYKDTKPYKDEWGVQWETAPYTTPFGEGIYTEARRGPLFDDDAINQYSAPDPNRAELYENLQRLIDTYQDEYYIIGRLHCTIFETAWALRGFEKLLADFSFAPELVDRILEIPYQYHKIVACKMASMGVDMIWLGDDVSGQDNLLMSPAMWRKFLKVRMADIITSVKKIKPNIKVAYHCDGNVMKLIPELIEIGIDVLNPVQAESMDPAMVKEKYGDKLCFFGSIAVQSTLPFGTLEDVQNEVLARMNTIGKGGGWICAPTHHIQLDTPMENFWAMVNTVVNTPYNK
jgi:uroporphyrinogen decarboxylase